VFVICLLGTSSHVQVAAGGRGTAARLIAGKGSGDASLAIEVHRGFSPARAAAMHRWRLRLGNLSAWDVGDVQDWIVFSFSRE
jgi:hypothetical protein